MEGTDERLDRHRAKYALINLEMESRGESPIPDIPGVGRAERAEMTTFVTFIDVRTTPPANSQETTLSARS